ncbi:MAG TPA: hypothetical protein VM098_05535 [Phycisphaerae bacterium]|nr:hypothetical protein [Phycisphaerae bacterium]
MAVSSDPRSPKRLPLAKWCVVALLGAALGCLLWEAGVGAADTRGGAAAGGDVLLVAGQITSDTYGLYIVDTRRSTIGVYQWLPGTRKLRLLAARNYSFDLQLDDYNTEPLPRDIKKLVEQSRPLGGAPRTRPK